MFDLRWFWLNRELVSGGKFFRRAVRRTRQILFQKTMLFLFLSSSFLCLWLREAAAGATPDHEGQLQGHGVRLHKATTVPSVRLHNVSVVASSSLSGKPSAFPTTVTPGIDVTVVGKTLSPTVDVFYGLPYGQADVWRTPRVPREEQYDLHQPGKKLQGSPRTFDATSPVAPCHAADMTMSQKAGAGTTGSVRKGGPPFASSRWCLTLDIYTPAAAPSASSPLIRSRAARLLSRGDDTGGTDSPPGREVDGDSSSSRPSARLHPQLHTTDSGFSARNARPLLPVFVYFTGSCFAGADNTSGQLLLEGFARIRKEAIFVGVMHRSGSLGFAGSEALGRPPTAESDADSRSDGGEGEGFLANWALQDALLALEFVQRHIHSFGGDPTKVALYGQSSGACMVSALYTTKKRGLFQSAIADSGGFNGWCTVSLALAEETFAALYKNGVVQQRSTSDRCSPLEDDQRRKICMRDWLREQPEELINGWAAESPCFTECASTLVVDAPSTVNSTTRSLLPAPLLYLVDPAFGYLETWQRNIPLLHGSMLDDGVDFMQNTTAIATATDFADYVRLGWGPAFGVFPPKDKHDFPPLGAFLNLTKERYNPNNSYLTNPASGVHAAYKNKLPGAVSPWYLAAERLYTEWEYNCPTMQASELLGSAWWDSSSPPSTKKGAVAEQRSSRVWEYTYVRPPPDGDFFVRHGSELWSVFPDFSQMGNKDDVVLAKRVLALWWEFADGRGFSNSRAPGISADFARSVRSGPSPSPDVVATNSSDGEDEELLYWPAYSKKKPFSFAMGAGKDWGRNAALDKLDRCREVWNRHWRVWQGVCLRVTGGDGRGWGGGGFMGAANPENASSEETDDRVIFL